MTREHEEEVDLAFEEGQNSMMRSLREARGQRDTWAQRAGESERARLAAQVERDAALARLSRAREALGALLHCGPKGYELEALMDTPEEARALAALRAALAEPPGGDA